MVCEPTGEVGFDKKINPGIGSWMNGNFACDTGEKRVPDRISGKT